MRSSRGRPKISLRYSESMPRHRLLSDFWPLLLAVAVCAPRAQSQGAVGFAASQRANDVQTIDASRLYDVINLDAPWRFQAEAGRNSKSDARYADTSFDDSAWTLLKPNQTLSSAGLPVLTGGYAWARIHLHVLNATGPLGIAIAHRSGLPYAVFANGRQIDTSRSEGARLNQHDPPFAIALPQGTDLVVAIRFFVPGKTMIGPIQFFPLRGVQIGPLATLRDATELARIDEFDTDSLSTLISVLLFFAFVPLSLALYLAQRDHSEYLWLGLYCFFTAASETCRLVNESGIVVDGNLNVLLWRFSGFLGAACSLEFVMRFARFKSRRMARALQIMFLIVPPLGPAGHEQLFEMIFVPLMLLWFGFLIFLLVFAYRRRIPEAKLLIPPFAVEILVVAYRYAAQIFPKSVAFPPPIRVGRVAFDILDLSEALLFLGILAVMFYRFIRVTKDEERSAAELAAARSTQQLLLARASQSTPGFKVETVYYPASEVGGDFFFVAPSPSGSLVVVVGDVSGKGLIAAMRVAMVLGVLRREDSREPTQILHNLNEALLAQGELGFTTGCCIRLEQDGQFLLANAGHIAPYIDGQEITTPPALPLGIAPGQQYEEVIGNLEAYQKLVLISDGVLEARSTTGELLGFDRLAALTRKSAREIADAAKNFGQEDDITVVLLNLAS